MNIQNAKLGFDPSFYELIPGKHRDKKVIWVKFEYNISLIETLKLHTKAKWSASEKSWYIALF